MLCLHWNRKIDRWIWFNSFGYGFRVVRPVTFSEACGMFEANVPPLIRYLTGWQPPCFWYAVELIKSRPVE